MRIALARRAGSGLGQLCRDIGFDSRSLTSRLGVSATAALYRGEPAAVRRALGDSPWDDAVRLFVLHDSLSLQRAQQLMDTSLIDALLSLDWAHNDRDSNGSARLRITVDIRPHDIDRGDAGTHPSMNGECGDDDASIRTIVVSDMDASMVDHVPQKEHVLGVGAASLSLLSAVPTTPVSTVLDLGCGSGIQLLGQAHCAEQLIGTDISARALEFAHATAAANGIYCDLRQGAWFEPLAGEQVDRIVANPPFVVGPPSIRHVYRDSGEDLDGATAKVVQQSCAHLNPGGTAHLLGAWVYTDENNPVSWQARVRSWIPSSGINAWVLERDRVDVQRYVSTWLTDESIDPRSTEGQRTAAAWLDHFAQAGVTHVGFGFIHLRSTGDDHPSEVVCEDFSTASTTGLGDEVEEYFLRTSWLREHSAETLARQRYRVRPGVCIDRISRADRENGMGFIPEVVHIARTDGPRFSHEIDDGVLSLLSGFHPDGLSLAEITEIYATSAGIDHAALLEAAIPIVVDLIRHGIVLPADLT